MDQDISKWKKMWQSQTAQAVDIDSLISQLQKIDKKAKRERIIILVSFIFTIAGLGSLIPLLNSLIYWIAFALMTCAMLMILYRVFMIKLKSSNQEDFNNKDFVKHQISFLKARMKTTSKYMWIYAILLCLGINVGYIEALQWFSPTIRVLLHVGVTSMMLLGMYFGIKKRMKQYKEEVIPLVSTLEGMT